MFMCELYGASAATPIPHTRWLLTFRARGGGTADNPDGWGVAHWSGAQAALEKSPEPAHRSARLQQLAQEIASPLVLAHVRKATHPAAPGPLNTHPFAHDCCDREWVFAHNGMVPAIVGQPCAYSCRPAGETDSEFAFCHLLAGIVDAYDVAALEPWLGRLAQVATRIAALGKFNFLLSDGRVLLAYGHDRLHYAERPGLALVATEPLDDGAWRPFVPGELRVYRDGAPLASHVAEPAAAGH